MDNKYQESKIYRLKCEDGNYYIGSTIQSLPDRLKKHKSLSKSNTNSLYNHINNVGWDTVIIELITEYPCNSKKELNTKEEEYIEHAMDDDLCLNHDLLNKYQNGKIYRLLCVDGHYYFGSTIQTLNMRFYRHKKDALTSTSKVYQHIKQIGIDNVTIELVEAYPCKSLQELYKRENDYIRDALNDKLCLNYHRSYTSEEDKKENMKQYYEEHKEKILDYHKQYNQENHEEILQKQAEYRQSHRDILNQKQREYIQNLSEEQKTHHREVMKTYREENKEHINKTMKEYRENNKEKVEEWKTKWYEKHKEETKEERQRLSEEKRALRQEKSQERIRRDREIHTCECGGTYQFYQKKRHMESKKHLSFVE